MTLPDEKNSSPSLLVIDDDPLMRRSIALCLADYGYQVLQAEDGSQGVALFDQHRPDLVLTDLMMPGLDGVGVVRAIRERTDEVPVVVISGNGSVAYAIEAMRQGAWDYITKPIHDFSELDRVISQSLERVEQKRAEEQRRLDLALHSIDLAEQLAALKHHDPLTGLPQLQQLQEIFYQTVIRGDFSGNMRLLLLDLVNLKQINKSLGVEFGDIVIMETAERLRPFGNEQRIIGRIGGDQFMILDSGDQDLYSLIEMLQQALDPPFTLGGVERTVPVAIGASCYPQDGESLNRLVQNAVIALGSAKRMGKRGFCIYQSKLGEQAAKRAALEADLHKALERGEFSLMYQPKLTAADGRLAGMEALLRWNRKGGQPPVGPDQFVPVLEESGLIHTVGAWVLETACRQYRAWREAGMAQVRLSVNISPLQAQQPGFAELIMQTLDKTGMAPEDLCLELTEGALLDADETVQAELHTLADSGVLLSIDDFGTGYATLSYLLRLPIKEIKIDRMFIRKLPDDKNAVAIIDAVIGLSRSMGITVTAEGVELQEQAAYLVAIGCDELQGYLLSRPVPAAEFATAWLPKS